MAHENQTSNSKSTTWAMFEEPDTIENRATTLVLQKPPPSTARRIPRQQRARFTVAAILEAAAAVIDEEGWPQASTNRIAERAGVSIGSLYQYFPNKEAILAQLMEHHRTAVHRVIARSLDRRADPSVAVDTALRGLFEDLIQLHRDDEVVTRVLSIHVPHHVPAERDSEDNRMIHRLEEILILRPDVTIRDTAAATHVLATATEALTRWIAHEAPEQLDTPTLVDEIVTMLSGYITGPSQTRGNNR